MSTPKKQDWLYWDVDNTLVMWYKPEGYTKKDAVKITDPYSGAVYDLYPHKSHIKLMKMLQARGSKIVVWSAGGYEWAKTIVEALKLPADVVLEKPATYWDDEECSAWMSSKPRWSKP